MKDIKRILTNSLYLFLREVFNKLTFVLLIIFIGRYLGSKNLGSFSFVIYFCQLAFLASDLGLSTLLIREIARNKNLANKYVTNFCVIRIAVGAVILLVIYMIANTIGSSKIGEVKYILLLSASSFFIMAITDVFISAFRAYEKMNYELIANVPKNLVFLSLSVWAILGNKGLGTIFSAFLLSNVIALIASYFIYNTKIGRLHAVFDFEFCKTAVKSAVPFWLAIFFVTIYFRIDSLMLFFMKDAAAVGFYNAAYVAIDGYLVISGIIVISLFPFFSRTYESSRDYLKLAYRNSLAAIFFLFLSISILISIFAGPIMRILYGTRFDSSIPVLQILAWAGFFIAMGNLNGHLAYAINRQNVVVLTAFLGVILNIILNLILIPPLSFLGASIATIITEAFLFAFLFLFVYFRFYRK